MSEEIKPILNRLKMFSKYKKYIYPIEMDISECKMLYDYINTLEKTIKKKDEGIKAFVDELCEYAEKEEKLLLIIKAIKQQCDVTENYEMNEFIRQLENESVDSKWLKRVAGDDKI